MGLNKKQKQFVDEEFGCLWAAVSIGLSHLEGSKEEKENTEKSVIKYLLGLGEYLELDSNRFKHLDWVQELYK